MDRCDLCYRETSPSNMFCWVNGYIRDGCFGEHVIQVCHNCHDRLISKTKSGDFGIQTYKVPIKRATCYRCQLKGPESQGKCDVGYLTPCGVYACRECKDSGVRTVYRSDPLFGGAFARDMEPCHCEAKWNAALYLERIGV